MGTAPATGDVRAQQFSEGGLPEGPCNSFSRLRNLPLDSGQYGTVAVKRKSLPEWRYFKRDNPLLTDKRHIGFA